VAGEKNRGKRVAIAGISRSDLASLAASRGH